MANLARIALTALPVIGLAGIWALSDIQSRQGTDWDVPIQGYDPRDLLRGHYVEFTYDWPGLADDEFGLPERLCIAGTAPVVKSVSKLLDGEPACDNMAVAELGSIYGGESLVRGRLYVEQDRALELEETLMDREQQGYARVRLRDDGKLTPLDIWFEPATAPTVPVDP